MARRLLTLAVAGMLAAGFAAQASAQDYPTQAIKLVIAFGPGGRSPLTLEQQHVQVHRCLPLARRHGRVADR